MSVLLDVGEMIDIVTMPLEQDFNLCKAQAKKILIELQAIYNLPDEGMFHKKMGEFIQELLECTK